MPIEIRDLAIRANAAPASSRVVKVSGSELSPEIDAQLESALVVDRLVMPDMFTLVFRDPDRDILARAGLEVGSRVAISTASLNADAPVELISGEVTGIEADYDALGSRAVVRGYDLSHRLTSGRTTRTFQNVKYADIARQIASDAGLQADVDDTVGTIDHVIQANASDLDFLYSLARRTGYDCMVDGDTLRFKHPVDSASAPAEGDFASLDPIQLVWNHNLLEFRARISAVAQVTDVKVRGWDPDRKEAVIGQADVPAVTAELAGSPSPADLAGRVGGGTLVVVDRPVSGQQAADALASARAQQIGSAAYEATALAIGSPALKAGVAVSISGVDPALVGKWVISSSRHEFGAGSYRTHVECTGRQDRSLHGLIANGLPGPGSQDAGRMNALVIALVTDNDDPLERGRVRLSYPWLGDEVESTWARVAMPGAGDGAGLVWLPEVGDEVIVGFQQGDISYPIVLGGLWNGSDRAPLGDGLFDAGKVKRSGFVSRKGHQLIFFDGDDQTGIALLSADGNYKVSLNQTTNELHVVAAGKLLIEAGSLEIKVDSSVKVTAGSGLDLEASGQLKIKGATVAIN